ncbi:MAG: zinc ribbon domain-containing protein [Desulfovibrio sp.]|jgi:putative FmdB family regulatory protein|nr:zinc ribbon domain-containing protein [Desulfovibrio sp.]
MPIFEYVCKKCGHEFEELVFGGVMPSCPACGTEKTQKLMSRCSHSSGKSGYDDNSYTPVPSSGGSCAGCGGGHCATCGH